MSTQYHIEFQKDKITKNAIRYQAPPHEVISGSLYIKKTAIGQSGIPEKINVSVDIQTSPIVPDEKGYAVGMEIEKLIQED